MTEPTIGDRIRVAREAVGLKQFGLAVAIGTSQPVVSRWEVNKFTPSPKFLYRIAKHCKVNANWILFGDCEICSK